MCDRCLKSPFKNQCTLILLLSLLFQPPGQDEQNGKHYHLLPQSFRTTLKDTSTNLSIDPIGISSLHDFTFTEKREYPNMVVKNIQIYVENGFASRKIKIKHFSYPSVKLSPWFLSSPPRQIQITHPLS